MSNLDLNIDTGLSAIDLFSTAMSLAGNFWVYLLLGLAFILAPLIYEIIVKATTKPKKRGRKKGSGGRKKSSGGRRKGSTGTRGPRKGSAAWWAAQGVNTIEVRYDKNPDGSYTRKELKTIAFPKR